MGKETKKQIREKFRNAVFKRDGYTCKLCGDKESKLDAHHIENRHIFRNGGYVLSNGITLCDKTDGCHIQVEDYYMNVVVAAKDSYDENNPHQMNPNNLYKMINSSLKQAEADDLKNI